MSLEVFLMKVAFFTEVAKMVTISFVKLLVIFKFCVVDESFRTSFKGAFVFWLFVVQSMSSEVLLGGEEFSANFARH